MYVPEFEICMEKDLENLFKIQPMLKWIDVKDVQLGF